MKAAPLAQYRLAERILIEKELSGIAIQGYYSIPNRSKRKRLAFAIALRAPRCV